MLFMPKQSGLAIFARQKLAKTETKLKPKLHWPYIKWMRHMVSILYLKIIFTKIQTASVCELHATIGELNLLLRQKNAKIQKVSSSLLFKIITIIPVNRAAWSSPIGFRWPNHRTCKLPKLCWVRFLTSSSLFSLIDCHTHTHTHTQLLLLNKQNFNR